MRMFDCFKRSKELITETEFVKIYKLVCGDKDYTIIIPKKIANKRTVIHFNEDTVCWEQIPLFPRLSGKYYRGDRVPIHKFVGNLRNTIFVVKGAPLSDIGLDHGIFRSPRKYDEKFVNCMTYKRFKKM